MDMLIENNIFSDNLKCVKCLSNMITYYGNNGLNQLLNIFKIIDGLQYENCKFDFGELSIVMNNENELEELIKNKLFLQIISLLTKFYVNNIIDSEIKIVCSLDNSAHQMIQVNRDFVNSNETIKISKGGVPLKKQFEIQWFIRLTKNS